ncbi:GATOR complex protein wdr59 [Coemansia sp. RSA 1694]|nr:GATOR complex protein wdr59 [Coemansia sp. RSA 1694]
MVSHTAAAAAEDDDDLVCARFPEQWKLVYARTLYRWEMDTKAVEVLKCIEDAGTRRLYTQLQCQPTEPQHDNLPRCGISSSKGISSSSSSEPSSVTRGAPWLTCSWCHEYVHGRALICHACGHGGHQLHMLRWFRSARKQLTRIGLAPVNGSRFGASNSNSSSSSNLGLLARPTAGAGPGAAFSPELAPLLPAPLSGIIRQKPALAVMSPTHDPACDDAAANRALLLDMQTTTMTTLPPAAGHLSRRGSKANILSQPASSDSSVAGYSDDDDDDFGYGVQSMLLSSRADDNDDEMSGDMQQQQQQEWDSSDVDSDDHLHTHPRAAAEVRQLSRRRSPPPATPPLQRLDGDEAFDMQLEIPTCPTGCGCNCIYESRRLIM